MRKLRENRVALLYAHAADIIDDEQFLLLYDVNTAKSPDLPYWKYEPFDFENMSDD